MAETNALLKRHTGNRIEGSNPSVSAKWLIIARKFFISGLLPISVDLSVSTSRSANAGLASRQVIAGVPFGAICGHRTTHD